MSPQQEQLVEEQQAKSSFNSWLCNPETIQFRKTLEEKLELIYDQFAYHDLSGDELKYLSRECKVLREIISDLTRKV